MDEKSLYLYSLVTHSLLPKSFLRKKGKICKLPNFMVECYVTYLHNYVVETYNSCLTQRSVSGMPKRFGRMNCVEENEKRVDFLVKIPRGLSQNWSYFIQMS